MFNNMCACISQCLTVLHMHPQAIVWIEFWLFMAFGVVQLMLGFFPSGNRKAEVSYIVLSMVAKFILGVFLFANTIFV